MAISTVNIGSAPNDGTGDPLRIAFNTLNTNFLNITADGGDEITVVDPTTATDQPLNNALANIYASGGGGSVTSVNGDTGVVVVDLQSATDVGNTITDGTDTNTVSANGMNISDGVDLADLQKNQLQITDFSETAILNKSGLNVSDGTNNLDATALDVFLSDGVDESRYANGSISFNGVQYPLPTGASSPLATLADITGGVTDGDKGDITVGSSGTVWTIDNGVVDNAKVASGIDAVKIADGSVSNTELQYINSLTSNAQTQLDHRSIVLLNDNVDSSAVTGTVANTILKSYLIPANTLAVGDTIDVKAVCSKTNGGSPANCNFRLYTNTANSLTSASALALVVPASNNLYFSLDRTYTLKSGNTLESFPVNSASATDEVATATAISNTAFNPAVDNYIIVAIQPNNASDSFKQTLFYMTLMKSKTSI